MALIDEWRGLAYEIRSTVPQSLGLRSDTVTIRTTTWTGGSINLGDPIHSDVLITPNPTIREIPGQGDRMLRVGPLTPAFVTDCVGSGGVAYSDLVSEVDAGCSTGAERTFLVTGPNGTRVYRLDSIDTSRDISWWLVLSTLERAHPF